MPRPSETAVCCSSAAGTPSRRSGSRSCSTPSSIRSSIRASGAPRQACTPWPKPRCGTAQPRSRSISLGRREARRIAGAGRVGQEHLLPRLERDAGQLGVPGDEPLHPGDRGLEAEELLERRGPARVVPLGGGVPRRIGEEVGQGRADEVGRGLVPGEHEPREHREHLEVGHRDGAGVPLVPDVADEVVAAVVLARRHQLEQVVVQVEEQLRLLVRRARVVDVAGPEEEAEGGTDPVGPRPDRCRRGG